MKKLFFSSDNHFDLNKLEDNLEEIIFQQAEFLVTSNASAYVIAGDLFNDFTKSIQYVEQLKNQLNTHHISVYFIAGNHDMFSGVSFQELNKAQPNYLNNQFIDFEDSRVIGINGWYDYSFVINDYNEEELVLFKKAFWADRVIDQPISDIERFNEEYSQLKNLLNKANDKNIIVVTHFLPNDFEIKRFPNQPRWDKTNAFMGSNKLQELIDQYPNITDVVYGHLHSKTNSYQFHDANFHNVSLGYNRGRSEWLFPNNFLMSWVNSLKVLEV